MKANRITDHFLDESPRDTVLILPGGGYGYASKREAEPVARLFNDHAYHAAVFEYRNQIKRYPELFEEAYALVDGFRRRQPVKRLFILGFSAGGHFALQLLEARPQWFAGGILAYPVVSAKPQLAHERSFQNLFGRRPTAAEIALVSLEDHVREDMPPLFVWHTVTDETVPVANTELLIEALKAKGVSVEAHLFPTGRHGLSLVTKATAFPEMDPDEYLRRNRDVSRWVELMFAWIERS